MSDNRPLSRHEIAIVRLIPKAKSIADEAARRNGWDVRVLGRDGGVNDTEKWNKIYHAAMDELAYRAGLRRMSWQGRDDD